MQGRLFNKGYLVMRFLDDFFPALIFFIAYKIYGIYWGTFALIIGSGLQVLYMQLRYKKVQPIYWISFLLILIFGGATILFRDARFLQWKVSIINWVMGAAFLLSHFFKRTLIELLISAKQKVPLPLVVLRKLNFVWALFFLFLGTLNIYIAYHYSMNAWVDFKVFGIFGLTILFVVLQTVYLMFLMKKFRQ